MTLLDLHVKAVLLHFDALCEAVAYVLDERRPRTNKATSRTISRPRRRGQR